MNSLGMKQLAVALILLVTGRQAIQAQPDRWQQRVKYAMDINMDAQANRFSGKQRLEYFNNSPDTLYKVFYHLYWNAFQPNSMMDVRSRELGRILLGRDRLGNDKYDWDARVRDRISKLQPNEIGYQKVLSLKRDGVPQEFNVIETILEVPLKKPILPNSSTVFEMDFEAQVPVQIRRSGRNNSEGVDYSMAQWYPKMCEYDYEGWHPTPYIAREFYGVWGDYDVKISIDKRFVVAATGYLQNPGEIGYGYETPGTTVKRPAGDRLTWHFTAPNVHDFVWATDPDYKHITQQVDGFTAHFFYIENDITRTTWPQFAKMIPRAYDYIKTHYGPYPYKSYSFIQGGDGGMEYPMATLIMGNGRLNGLYGLAMHEWMHSWYQGMLGTNESLYPWMDEGFTTFAEDNVMYHTLDSLAGRNPHAGSYAGYFNLARSGYEEPLSTHADHYNTNYAYTQSAYAKGAVFLEQLGYVIGADNRDKGLLRYYRDWRFKHPNANDFVREMEKQSGLQLDWYRLYFVNSTKHIDYGIDSVYESNGKTIVRLRRIDLMPMPIDLVVTGRDGKQEMHYIPLSLMFGAKPNESPSMPRIVHDYWLWTHRTYDVVIDRPMDQISTLEIDPSQRLADLDRRNNKVELSPALARHTVGNPVITGWYADPEAAIFNNKYWIFPTYSARYEDQVFFDAFSSSDLGNWVKHEKVLDTAAVKWARKAMWAPAIVEKDGKYYFFFAANDIQNDKEKGGIGVAVADNPAGPYKDYLGRPLIDRFHNGAQPIDQFVFHDKDGQYYIIYGGWRHCNIAKLNPSFTGFEPFADGSTFREITPAGYVEGPFMFIRNGKYYFMWSEGGWGGPDYSVAYAIADSPLGPFKRIGKILQQDTAVATGAGHHSVINIPGTDSWYIVYHRRPLSETAANNRVVCIDEMHFDEKGFIQPVKITTDGVQQREIN